MIYFEKNVRLPSNVLNTLYESQALKLHSRQDIKSAKNIVGYSGSSIVSAVVYSVRTKDKIKFNDIFVYWGKTPKVRNQTIQALKLLPNNSYSTIEATTFNIKATPYMKIHVHKKMTFTGKNDLIKLTKSNVSRYRQDFIQLLVAHDIKLAKHFNSSTRTKFRKTNLQNRSHIIKMNYFISSIVSSSDWMTYILFDEDEIVGFVKAEIHKGIGRIDTYLKKEDDSHSEEVKYAISKIFAVKKPKLMYSYYYTSDKFCKRMNSILGGTELTRWFIKQ